jgi:hypothetical protein
LGGSGDIGKGEGARTLPRGLRNRSGRHAQHTPATKAPQTGEHRSDGRCTPHSRIRVLSADGYFASADGNLNWVVPDDEQAKAAATGMPAADTVLFGRRTYELFEGMWRKALQDSATALILTGQANDRKSTERSPAG